MRLVWLIIIFVVVDIAIGIMIGGQRKVYNELPMIDSASSFESALKEDIGDCLIEGQVVAIDPVEGKYSYVLEKYQTKQTHMRTYTDSDGHSHTRFEDEWEADRRVELLGGG